MPDRSQLAQSFLTSAGWPTAQRDHLAGDASNRRYERLLQPDGARAVLMDAPPEEGEDVRPFVRIAEFLLSQGLSAPQILAQDAENGFLLLEDLGDALFARVLETRADLEPKFYEAAADTLVALHEAAPPQNLVSYDTGTLAQLIEPAWRWYLRDSEPKHEEQAPFFQKKFETVLADNVATPDVLILRDYHAENLIWLPDRKGVAGVGLLDFQDAAIGHRAYDLVSLLQDVRRDVHPDIQARTIRHYISQTRQNDAEFQAAYHLLGLQRNLRILGVFARLSLHFGKPQYVDLIPRVWRHVETNLAHPVAHELRDVIHHQLPKPTPEFLQKLRDQCGTVPTL